MKHSPHPKLNPETTLHSVGEYISFLEAWERKEIREENVPVSDLELFDSTADFDDFSHTFVTEDVSSFHLEDSAVKQVHVCAKESGNKRKC
jgi:hypothetical protein